MKNYLQLIQRHFGLLAWLMSWVVVASVMQDLLLIYIPLSVIVMKSRGMELEILLGFLFLLILSDSRQPIFQFAINVKNIYIVLLALFFFMDSKNLETKNRLFIAFLPFILFASICIIYSPVSGTAAQKTLSYFLVILVAPNLLQKLLYDDHEKVIKGITFLMSIVLYVGLALKFLMPEFSTLEGRFTGLFGNPNGLGIYASISFAFFSIMVNRFPEHFNLFLKALIYAGLMLSIWFCGSRNALVAVMLFILFRNLYGLSPYIGFLIFMLLVASFTYIQNNLVPIIIGLGLEEYFRIETLEGGSGRTIAWDFAWEQIDKDPYIGKGFAYTEYIFKENYNYLSMLGHQGNAHNSYLTIWMDTGFIGLFFFAVAFIGQFIKASKGSVLAIPALYLVLFSGNFESWIAASLNPVTILVWMMLALMTFPKEELEYDEETDEEPEEESGNLIPAHV